MNIFYLDKDPLKAAVVQYNKHVVKMILESAQMLCTAHHELLHDHLSIIKCKEPLRLAPINMPTYEFEQPPQCMPDEYKDKCSIQAYWNYYIGEKHIVANPKTEKIYEQRPY